MPEDISKKPVQQPSEADVEIAKRRQQAVVEVLRLFEQHFQTTLESHPETVLYAAAWLAGTSLYRSLGYEQSIAPGTVVLSEKANQQWPKLMNVFVFILGHDGINITPGDLDYRIPTKNQPRKTILQIQEVFQDQYNEIMRKHGFGYFEGAVTGAAVCVFAFKFHCILNKQLDQKLAAAIVAMGFIEGTKTTPIPLKPAA